MCCWHVPLGNAGADWGWLGSLTQYAPKENFQPDESGLSPICCPLMLRGAGLGPYQRMLGGTTVYRVFVIWPGPPGSPSRLRTGILLRAVWTRSLDTARQGLAFHAVSVHIPGPGSAGDAPNCITPGAGLAAAMLMSCAVALFARELPRPSTPTDPVWIHMISSPWGDLTPTYELPWAIVLAIADLAAAARVEVEPALSEVPVPM